MHIMNKVTSLTRRFQYHKTYSTKGLNILVQLNQKYRRIHNVLFSFIHDSDIYCHYLYHHRNHFNFKAVKIFPIGGMTSSSYTHYNWMVRFNNYDRVSSLTLWCYHRGHDALDQHPCYVRIECSPSSLGPVSAISYGKISPFSRPRLALR